MSTEKIVWIPGDGIGAEISKAAQRVITATGAPLEWDVHLAGATALEQHGEVLPGTTLDALREHQVAIKGPCTTPVGKGYTSVNVQLRRTLDLYAAVRPVRNLDGVKTRFDDVDCVIIRENTEGLYSGIENEIVPGVVTSLKVASIHASERIARWAFEYARRRGRKKITVFHKANIMKMSDGLFIDCSRRVAEEYSDIEYDELIIDAGCMRLVQDPSKFDMLLLENLYGDVLSDLCAGLVGGLGVVPGANIGEDGAIFEAVHGSAPDIAGQGIANPLALIMSATMMLNYLTERGGNQAFAEAASAIKLAYNQALSDGAVTGDLGGSLNTQGFADALIERLNG